MNTNNSCVLNVAGKNANDTYTVNVPSNLLGFCRYDFSKFMEESTRLCRECMVTGEYPLDKVTALRNSISGCHRYFENNIRTVFDKIVTDCWIEYICRQGEINTSTLWNSFIECENPFQKAIFQRLTEYRSHSAINQWINLLKIQEYAVKKLDFVFGCKLSGPDAAANRLNLFDLMFSVAANEQGYSLDAIGSVRVYKPGRLTNAPFVFSGVSKEIVRNLFQDVEFSDSLSYASREEGAMSDWEAMDSFGVIKNHLPQHSDTVAKIIMKSLVKVPDTVYIPSTFKAMIDLEIDTVIDKGGYLQRCARCKEFFLRDRNCASDFCDTVHRDGSTCREIMEGPVAEPLTDEELEVLTAKAEQIYIEMSENVNRNISQRDFTEWSGYFNVIKNNVINGRATASDFDDFIAYSKQLAAQKPSKAKQEVIDTEEEIRRADGTKMKVKPYQFARVDRKELEKQGLLKPQGGGEEKLPVQEQKAVTAAPPPVAKIIRGAQPVNSYQEIPVRMSDDKDNHSVDPVKKDVFFGEDFSGAFDADNSNKGYPSAKENNVNRAAEAARAEILNIAENSRAENKSNEKSVGDTMPPQNGSRIEGLDPPSHVSEQTSSLDKNSYILPDLDEFPNEPDFSEFDQPEADIGEKSVKHEPPRVKLPEFEKTNGREDDFVTLIDEKEKEESHAIVKPPRQSQKRTGGMNKAARVAGAYRTVAQMNKENDVAANEAGKEKTDSIADDFAKILNSIERNDGFDDEDLPLDPEGVPLSHKTKHVMNAIMKNSSVSPSLTYGRRQAAEKNVIIDEDYVEKNKK